MKLLFFLFISLSLAASPLWAAGHDQVTFAGQVNSKFYPYSKLASGFDSVKSVYGVRLDYLHEMSPNFWLGGGYTRARGALKNTESNAEFMELVAEHFFGSQETLKQKGPLWDKLYYKIGGRVGLYRWMVQSKKPGVLTELNYGPTFYSFGWTFAPHVAIGLGDLGYLEYSSRMHFSGGADTSALNNTYLSYVYALIF